MSFISYIYRGDLHIIAPAIGFRLAVSDGEFVFDRPYRLDEILRRSSDERLASLVLESEEAWLLRVTAKDVPSDATNIRIVNADLLPADRTFREAWEDDGRQITVNMAKARDLHRERLRQARAPRLMALDIEYQRADEIKDENRKREIAIEKQALRDVTADPAIDAAATPEELKAVMPAILKF